MKPGAILMFALGPIAAAAIGLITVPAIAWAFSAEEVGRLNMLQITESFCLLVFVLGLDQAYAREFHESTSRARLLKSCLYPGFILLVSIGLISLWFSSELSLLLYGQDIPALYWITLACVTAALLSRFLMLIMRMQERGLIFSLSTIAPRIVLIAVAVGVVLLGMPRTFSELQLAFFCSSVVLLTACLWGVRKDWMAAVLAETDWQQMRSLLKFGAPLVLSGLAYWGLIASGTIALRSLSSFSELGIYSVASSFAGAAAVIQSIFSTVWAPIVYKWAAERVDMSRIDSVARQVLALVCGIFILCGTFSWSIDYILPAGYAEVKYLVLCTIAQPLLYVMSEVTSVGIGITRKTIFNAWAALGALISGALLCLWLVPDYGARGAVIATTLAYVVFFVAKTEASAHVWRRFPRRTIYMAVGFMVTLAILTVLLGPVLPFHYSLVWLVLLPCSIWFFWDELAAIKILCAR